VPVAMLNDLRKTKRPLIGFSTTVLGSPAELTELIDARPGVVELCGVTHSRWPATTQALMDGGVAFGLHCPVPFDGYPAHFDITGPDPARQTYAFDLLRRTLDAAARTGGTYVVAHFPSVFATRPSPNTSNGREHAYDAAAQVTDLQREYRIPVLLENVGPNRSFGTAEDFLRLFEAHTDLRMCLDFGHVHAVQGGDEVYSFTRSVAPHVSSIHVYNTTHGLNGAGFHHPPYLGSRADGWMDLPRLLRTVMGPDTLDFIVFEYSAARGLPRGHLAESLGYLSEIWEVCASRE
jgi:sugar phosphate isomerase/epimerase